MYFTERKLYQKHVTQQSGPQSIWWLIQTNTLWNGSLSRFSFLINKATLTKTILAWEIVP